MSLKILVVHTAFIGDIVLSTPIIAKLKQLYPGCSLSVLTTPVSREVFAYHPDVEEVLVFDKRGAQKGILGLFRQAKELRSKKFEIVFSLHKSWRTAALLWLSRISKRYGFSDAAGCFLYTKTVNRKDMKHEVMRSLALLRNVNVEPSESDGNLCVKIPQLAFDEAEKLGVGETGEKYIAIAPGSVWLTKRWSVEGFSEVARALQSDGYTIVLIGGKADKEAADEIERRAGKELINTVGKTSLLSAAAIISKSVLLITNDSSPLHFASAVKTPIVAIFCATVPEFGFGPWQVPNRIVQVEGLSCRPCGRHGHKTCPLKTYDCQKDLTVGMVLDAVNDLQKEILHG